MALSLRASPVALVALACAGLMGVIQALVLHAALAPGRRLGDGVWIALGAFFVVLALVLPRVRRNPWIGVRTPWTLTSDENWARTHRVAGYAMLAGGIVVAVLGSRGPHGLAMAAIVVCCLAPVAWSWHLHRRSGG